MSHAFDLVSDKSVPFVAAPTPIGKGIPVDMPDIYLTPIDHD